MIAGNHWADATGSPDVFTLDMGGTSADVGVVADGQLRSRALFEVEWGLPIALPIIDVTTIGAGGSSIAALRLRRPPQGRPRERRRRPRSRPRTARAARTPPSPTPTSSSAGSTPTTSWAASSSCTSTWRGGPSSRSPSGWAASLEDAAEAIVSVSIENMAGAVRLRDRRPRPRLPRLRPGRLRWRRARCTRRDRPPRGHAARHRPAQPGPRLGLRRAGRRPAGRPSPDADAAVRLRHRRRPAGRPAHRRRAGAATSCGARARSAGRTWP